MNRVSKLSYLEKQVSSAISIITDTITKLERNTAEYESEKDAIKKEVAELEFMSKSVDEKIGQNNKLIANFKKLLA